MKIATYVMTYDQGKWIMRNLENAYPHVDRIYVMHSKLPWGYNPDARSTYTNDFDINIIKQSKYMDKITIIEGDWMSDTEERNDCLQIAKQDGFDYLMVHDADEFYFHKDFGKIIQTVRDNPNIDVFGINLFVFWKSFKYIIINHDGSKISGNNQTIVNLKTVKQYDYIRDVKIPHNFMIIPDVICYHGSYVLNDDQVYKKISTWGHSADFDTNKWYNEIWLSWTLELKNLHPIWPWVWNHCEIFEDELPEVIADLKYTEYLNPIILMRNELHEKEGLKELCKEFPEDVIMAEIGSYAGESTKIFLESGKIKQLYAIDPWLPGYDNTDFASSTDFKLVEEKFNKNVEGYNIIKMKTTFARAFNFLPELDVIYIDGNHQYNAVKEDIELALRKIKKGGIICGHDYHGYALDTVVKAVDELLGNPEKIFVDSSWIVKIK